MATSSSPIDLSSPFPEKFNGEALLHMGSPTEDSQPGQEEEPDFMVIDDDAPEGQQEGTPADNAAIKEIRRKKDPAVLEREPGKSLLPHSRVQKIIKADKDIPIVAKDATYLIALATEEFIRRISEASAKVAKRENRSMVQGKDLASVVRRVDEFLFLEDIMPFITAEPKRTSKVKQATSNASPLKAVPTFMDQFVTKSAETEAQRESPAGGDAGDG